MAWEPSTGAGVTTDFRSFPLTFAVLRRSALDEVGIFDERFTTVCHENDDLGFRMLRQGWKIGRLERVFVNHRRTLFRSLSAAAPLDASAVPHAEALRHSSHRWNEKWGKPYGEAYFEWRYGRRAMALMRPYFWLRRLASVCRRALIESRLGSNR